MTPSRRGDNRDLPHEIPNNSPNESVPMPTAIELYDQATDLRDAGNKPAAIAKLYADLAETDKAILHAKKVVELEPDDTFSYTALSVIYQRCGKIPEAEQAKAIAFNKQHGLD